MAYDSSFAGVGFFVQGPSVPDANPMVITERHIPYGNANVTDSGGSMPRHITLTLFFVTEGDYLTLLATIRSLAASGGTGTLIYQEFPSGVQAFAINVTRTTRALGTSNQTSATVEFSLG